ILFRMTLLLGLRKGEILGLRWDDINLDTATIRIGGTLQRHSGKLHRERPKTNGSEAAMPIPANIVSALRSAPHQGEYVFTTSTGTAIEPSNLSREFKKILRSTNLPDIRFHDLRHSCATFLIAEGIHIRVVMEILRHRQISTTMDIY